MVMTRKSEQGFSLVEMAIVMVIIGLIVAAVTVGKSTMKSAETLKVYQKIVVPCVAAVSEGIRNGTTPTAPEVPTLKLGGSDITCAFASAENSLKNNEVQIVNAPADLLALMQKNLAKDSADVTVTGDVINLYAPGG